ncbi:MAG TPA: PQQ-binding-like beta-propeller repeat protein [Terriglobia bacterium]|nr:PQQ-binding-like beta-propeller repeat protein [Terriglobia bacterium]
MRRLLCLVVLTVATAWPQTGKDIEWRYYSGDNGATKYSPAAGIDRGNVAGLRVAWRHPHVDPAIVAANPQLRVSNRYMATPIMVDGMLFVTNGLGLAEAIDPGSGQTVWMQKPLTAGAAGLAGGTITKGVAYWRDGAGARILTIRQGYLFALDPKTGEPFSDFGDGGKVDLRAGLGPLATSYRWGGVPLVARDVVVVGATMLEQDSASNREGPPGDVRAFDVRTGKLRWTFHVIPRDGEAGTESWENRSYSYTGGANVWSMMSADDDLGYIYLPTTSATNDMYGGQRLGDNLYSSSIVCLEAATGKRVWHFQTVHHDLFDYDNPSAPMLIDIAVDGRPIRALAQVTKQAFVFVLDRVTGKPVWPIEERPVPASTVSGERASRTQPFPTKPPAFDRQGITVDDLIDFTPELRAEALRIIANYKYGPIFTPPSVAGDGPGATKGTIQLPGSTGGGSWPGGAFDPESGTLFVPSRTNPFVADLVKGVPGQTNLDFVAGSRPVIQGPEGLPLVKPPYGRITALDLNRGDKVWMVPNGDGPRNHPALKGLDPGPLGGAVPSALIATRTLLFATEADQITPRTPPNAGGKKLKALDKATGKTLWEMEFEAGANGSPMTYVYRGKQYVVVAIGGQAHRAELVALSLP